MFTLFPCSIWLGFLIWRPSPPRNRKKSTSSSDRPAMNLGDQTLRSAHLGTKSLAKTEIQRARLWLKEKQQLYLSVTSVNDIRNLDTVLWSLLRGGACWWFISSMRRIPMAIGTCDGNDGLAIWYNGIHILGLQIFRHPNRSLLPPCLEALPLAQRMLALVRNFSRGTNPTSVGKSVVFPTRPVLAGPLHYQKDQIFGTGQQSLFRTPITTSFQDVPKSPEKKLWKPCRPCHGILFLSHPVPESNDPALSMRSIFSHSQFQATCLPRHQEIRVDFMGVWDGLGQHR